MTTRIFSSAEYFLRVCLLKSRKTDSVLLLFCMTTPFLSILLRAAAVWVNPDLGDNKKSRDKGFIEICEDLLADKLVTLQCWKEDRAKDGFYYIDHGDIQNADYFSS